MVLVFLRTNNKGGALIYLKEVYKGYFMVSNVGLNLNTDFTYKAINYLNNEPLSNTEKSVFAEAKCAATGLPISIAFIEGPRALGFKFGKNKIGTGSGLIKSWGSTIKGYKQLGQQLKNVGTKNTGLGGLFSAQGWKDGAKNFTELDKIANPSKYIAKKTAEEGTKKGFARITGEIGKVFKAIKSPFGQAFSWAKNTSVGKFIKLPQLGELCKKGNAGFMAVFDGVMETFTEVIPAFKNGGVKEGFKQLGKSSLKVAAGTVAFVAGEAGGRAIGAIIGSAICPGIGTWVGGFLGGLFGGVFASSMAGKLVKNVAGKPYSETNAQAQKQQQAVEISQDVNTVNELKQAVADKIVQKQQSGKKLTKDDMTMLESLGKAMEAGSVSFGSLNTAAQTGTTNSIQNQTDTSKTPPSIQPQPVSFDVPPEIRAKNEYGYRQQLAYS